MNHDELKDLVFMLHDGELSPTATSHAESHLAACAECREELAAWKKTAALALPPSPVRPSEDFVNRVMERIELEPAPRTGLRGFFARSAEAFSFSRLALAGAAGLVLAFFYFSSLWRSPVPLPVQTAEDMTFVSNLMNEPFTTVADASDNTIDAELESYFL